MTPAHGLRVASSFVPMDGGHKPLMRAHELPEPRRASKSGLEQLPARASSDRRVERMDKLANTKLNVFTIETTSNNRMFDRPLELLA